MSEQNDDPSSEFDKPQNNTRGKGAFAVKKSLGLTETERDLASLAERTFLSLWSYPNIWRNQKGSGSKGDGKEVCDLLVVFENHVIIFSDKHIEFKLHTELKVAWRRWYKAAVKESAEQIYGAERWIREYPNHLFLDKACTQPFPVPLPSVERMKVHRVVVAHGAGEACRKYYGGGSGSLMIAPSLIGDDHLIAGNDTITVNGIEIPNPDKPFQIGQINPQRGYVHVLDDTSLDILFRTLDTVRDLVEYFERKERFIKSGKLVTAAGEDDLLAYYLRDVGKDNWNDFVIPKGFDFISIDEGLWVDFQKHPQRLAQLKADEISYAWDELIERFNKNILNDTQHSTTGQGIHDSEQLVRFLAREPRTRRRFLSESFIDLYEKSAGKPWQVRVMEPSRDRDPYYVFMVMKHPDHIPYEEYRQVRKHCLGEYMEVTKVVRPQAKDIVGIAIGRDDNSEDLMYVDTRNWTDEDLRRAKDIQKETGFLKNVNWFKDKIKTYPDVNTHIQPLKTSLKGRDRNKLCFCGSGRKYKYCHGKN
jgi:SEC-C motif